MLSGPVDEHPSRSRLGRAQRESKPDPRVEPLPYCPAASAMMYSIVMPLKSGARLGPYEVVAPVGAGGMGEVYRARDTRLGRDVAVKVLPSHLSENAEARARFEREARVVSAFNHPHICVLHDL